MENRKIILIGKNVEKSPSPEMHNAGLNALNLPFQYKAISIPEDAFKEQFLNLKYEAHGFNVTIPYKEKIIPFLDHLTQTGEKLQAVNTVYFKNHESFGENTDIAGFMQSLQESDFPSALYPASFSTTPVKNKTAFIFGAGGAAKASIEGLIQMGVQRFIIWSRSDERIAALRVWLQKRNHSEIKPDKRTGHEIQFIAGRVSKERFQSSIIECYIIVNASPLEAIKEIPWFSEIKLKQEAIVVDWVYSPIKTPWLEKADSNKGKTVEGYKILLYQGMKAFELWTQEKAPAEVMKKTLLKVLQ
jgi:shikimate dehydrogenase